MSEYREWMYPLLEHTHNAIEEKEMVFSGIHIVKNQFMLPGTERYNAGYGLTMLFCDDELLVHGRDWQEEQRKEHTSSDASTAYWTHRVSVQRPKRDGVYRFVWRSRIIVATVPGLREARLNRNGSVLLDGRSTMFPTPQNNAGRYPNGIAWSPLPDKYKIEIWRKTKHKQNNRQNYGVRWMLWRTVLASQGGFNFEAARWNAAGNRPRHTGTEAFRFAFLTPDGARSLLSPEVAVYHGGKSPWGPGQTTRITNVPSGTATFNNNSLNTLINNGQLRIEKSKGRIQPGRVRLK